jgi:sporulation protein YlmC with PRC-barrel domain
MRFVSITAAALALTAGVALAQTPSPGGLSTAPRSGSGIGAPAPAAVQHVPAINPLTAEDVSHITGTAVYGSDDKKIGSISHVLMKPDSKTIDRLVVAEGGVFGIGSHNVALPIDQFKWSQDKEGFVIAKTGDELKTMAEWQDPMREAAANGAATSR